MHDLIPLGPALPGSLTTAEIDATMAYAEAEKAVATREAYASDWRDFAAWCASRGATPCRRTSASSPPSIQPRSQRPQIVHHRAPGCRDRLPA